MREGLLDHRGGIYRDFKGDSVLMLKCGRGVDRTPLRRIESSLDLISWAAGCLYGEELIQIKRYEAQRMLCMKMHRRGGEE